MCGTYGFNLISVSDIWKWPLIILCSLYRSHKSFEALRLDWQTVPKDSEVRISTWSHCLHTIDRQLHWLRLLYIVHLYHKYVYLILFFESSSTSQFPGDESSRFYANVTSIILYATDTYNIRVYLSTCYCMFYILFLIIDSWL